MSSSMFANIVSLVDAGNSASTNIGSTGGLASGLESWMVGFESPEGDEGGENGDEDKAASVDENAEPGEVPAETIVDDGADATTDDEEELEDEAKDVEQEVEALYDATMGLLAYGPKNPMVAALTFKAGLHSSASVGALESYSAFLTDAINSGKHMALDDSAGSLEGILDDIAEKVKGIANRVAGMFSKVANVVISKVKSLFGKAEEAEKSMSSISKAAQEAGEEREAKLPPLSDVMFDFGAVMAGATALIGAVMAFGAGVHTTVADKIAGIYKQLKTGVGKQWRLVFGGTVTKTARSEAGTTLTKTHTRAGIGVAKYTRLKLKRLGYTFGKLGSALKDIVMKLSPSKLRADLKVLQDAGTNAAALSKKLAESSPSEYMARNERAKAAIAHKAHSAFGWMVEKAQVVTKAFSGVKHFLLHTMLGKITLAVTSCLAAFSIYRSINKAA